MKIELIRATSDHLNLLTDFQLAMAMETEGVALNPAQVQLGVEALLQGTQKGEYWLAQVDDTLASCMLVLGEWSDWRNGQVLWIHSVYVLPEFRGRGVFKAMYRFLQQKVLVEEELKGLRLYVDKGNHAAQKVYDQLGMKSDHYFLYEWLKPES